MKNGWDGRRSLSKRPLGQRLGLTVGLVVAGASGLSSLAVQAQEAPPGVVFLLDNHKSMQEYPQYLPEAFTPGYYPTPTNPAPGTLGSEGPAGLAINTGCSDPALVAAMSWFDKYSPDPAKNGSVVYDNDPDLGSPFFEPNKFYHSRGRRLGWQPEEFPFAADASFYYLNSADNSLMACYGSVNWDISNYPYSPMAPLIQECMSCLDNKGWWRGPIVTSRTAPNQAGPTRALDEPPLPPEAYRKWVLSGRVLNVRPPRFAMARKVLKDVIKTASNTRMGVATFGRDQGWFDPPEVIEGMRPACGYSLPTIHEGALDRPRLMSAVNRVLYRNKEHSVGEALFGLGGYFSSQRADWQWEYWFRQPINPGYFGWPGCCSGGTYDSPYTGQQGLYWGVATDEWLKPPRTESASGVFLPGQPFEDFDPAGYRSVCSPTQANAVIVVTNATPRSDNTVPITRMMQLLVDRGTRHDDGTPLSFDPAFPETNPSVGGVNYCDQAIKDDGTPHTKADCDYTGYNWPHGLGVGNKNFMDDVAFFLSHTDLRGDMPGSQSLRTHVIGFGDSSPMLQSIARAGRGVFFRADDEAQLRLAIQAALGSVQPSTGSGP